MALINQIANGAEPNAIYLACNQKDIQQLSYIYACHSKNFSNSIFKKSK